MTKTKSKAYVLSPKLADGIGVRILAIRPKTCNPEEGFLEAAWVSCGHVVFRH